MTWLSVWVRCSLNLQMTPNVEGWLIPPKIKLDFTMTLTDQRTEPKETKMSFNKIKCKVLQLGEENDINKYRIGDSWLTSSTCEKDLDVLVDYKLGINEQCDVAARKGKHHCFSRNTGPGTMGQTQCILLCFG